MRARPGSVRRLIVVSSGRTSEEMEQTCTTRFYFSPRFLDYNTAGGMKKAGSMWSNTKEENPTIREPPARLSLQLPFIIV